MNTNMSTLSSIANEDSTEPGPRNLSAATSVSDIDVWATLQYQAPYQASLTLLKVCSPIILALGTFGNCMTLIVLRTIPLGGASVSVFFAALAVSDLVQLYTGLLRRWLQSQINLEIRNLHDIICKLHIFFVYLSAMTSAWFLVAMTMQRVMSVLWPHRVGLLVTKRKAQVTVIVLTALLFALNVHILVAFTLHGDGDTVAAACDYNHHQALAYYDTYIYPWIDLVVTSLLPFSLLLIGNSILGATVAQSARVARRMTGQGQVREKAASSLTVTLLSVSATYLCLTSPVCVFIIVYNNYVEVGDDMNYEAWLELIFIVCNLLLYLNSAINFYLYCLTGTKFRAQCKRLLCRSHTTPASSGTHPSISTISSQITSSMNTNSKKDGKDTDDF